MDGNFLMASTSSITMQSLGKILQRAPAVACRCGNMVFVCFFFCNSVTLRGRRAVRSRVTYFEQVLCRGLLFDFDDAYIHFLSLIALSNVRKPLSAMAKKNITSAH